MFFINSSCLKQGLNISPGPAPCIDTLASPPSFNNLQSLFQTRLDTLFMHSYWYWIHEYRIHSIYSGPQIISTFLLRHLEHLSDKLALYKVTEIFHTMKILSLFLSRKLVPTKTWKDGGLLFFMPCTNIQTVFPSKKSRIKLPIFSQKI